MSRRLARFIYRWRYLLTALCGVGALASAPRANITTIDNDVTAWFSKDDPVYRDYERFREEFAGTRTLIIALQADSPDRLFSAATLAYIEQITEDIERVDTVQCVDSIARATIVEALPDGLDVRPLIDLARTRGPDGVRRRALEDELIRGDLVSEDATVTALIVSFDEDRIDAVRAGIIQRIHDVVDPRLPEGVHAYYNGSLEISETYNRVTLANQQKFTPPILLFTVLAIYATFRSWRKTFLTLIAVGMSVLWTLGLYSLFGFSYNVLSSMIVPLIVVLAIADDVHIMQHWDEERRLHDVEAAFTNTVAHLAKPLFGASATTALGMLSLATSDVVAVRSFGIGSAVGIMVDCGISLIVMPTLLSLVKPETQAAPHERFLLPPLRKVAMWSTRHPGRVLAASVIVAVVAGLGSLRLRVDTNHINFFSERHPLNESAAVIDRQLAGIYSFQIMLEGPPESMKRPDVLATLDRLQADLRRSPYVRKVTSVADYVKRIHRELNDGRQDAYVVPRDGDTIAQELFVFAMGGEGRHELDRIVASDYSRAQVSIKLQSMSSDLVLDEVERADALAKAAFADTNISVLTTGSGRLFSTLDRYLVMSQVSSFGTAFVTVFGVIFIVFRSARYGLLSIVPNLLPVVAVLGVMGYLDISVNIATVMVASVALGVVDDDTIHFINRYRREIAGGATMDQAIEVATVHEGRASLTTAIINSCGYAVLLLSEYRPTAWFGGLLALTMAVAFLAEVLILPATIKLLPRIFGPAAVRGAGTITAAVVVLAFGASSASAQSPGVPTGHVSIVGDYFPNRSGTREARARLFVEEEIDVSPTLRIVASGFVEGLLAHRPAPTNVFGTSESGIHGGIARMHDAYVEWRGTRADVRAGLARVVWGRLDELQPTDVINPLDVSRFFFDGRSEARLPVALVRARVLVSEALTVEAVYVPVFRRGRFDQLDEDSSPFMPDLALPVEARPCADVACPPMAVQLMERQPGVRLSNGQGGARLTATSGRVDWGVSAYRGIEPFPVYVAEPSPTPGSLLVATSHNAFTMVGGDVETVRGAWGLRGEVAAVADDSFQSPQLALVRGTSLDVGIGVDRRAGQYRLSGTVLARRESYETPLVAGGARSDSDVTFIAAADRSFAGERYRLRLFAVANASEGSGFSRGIFTAELRDNVALEGSTGWFLGESTDPIGRFSDNDFVYVRLKYYF